MPEGSKAEQHISRMSLGSSAEEAAIGLLLNQVAGPNKVGASPGVKVKRYGN